MNVTIEPVRGVQYNKCECLNQGIDVMVEPCDITRILEDWIAADAGCGQS